MESASAGEPISAASSASLDFSSTIKHLRELFRSSGPFATDLADVAA